MRGVISEGETSVDAPTPAFFSIMLRHSSSVTPRPVSTFDAIESVSERSPSRRCSDYARLDKLRIEAGRAVISEAEGLPENDTAARDRARAALVKKTLAA